MKVFWMVGAAALLAACGGSSDSTAPAASISGTYDLQSANGQALPAPGTVPFFGNVQIVSGTGVIDGSSVDVSIVTTLNTGSQISTVAFEESGTVSGSGPNYTFRFVDGTSASANCSSGICNVAYGSNSYVFVLQSRRPGPPTGTQ